MKKYTIGIDYGTLSGRAVLVDVENGEEICFSVAEYKHGVIDEYLPDSLERLAPETALQHPEDYLEVLRTTVPEVLRADNRNRR